MVDTSLTQATGAKPLLTCTACGNDNVVDSRFCRHCGTSLSSDGATRPSATAMGADGATASASATAGAAGTAGFTALADGAASDGVANGNGAVAQTVAMPEELPDLVADGHSASEEIDHRRAQQLIERAFMLAERGDKPTAIVACRQAVSLDPNAVSGYSILGLLLEQTGDIPNAIAAYEKVVQLAPDSLLEKESLERLRKMQTSSQAAAVFHFNEDELFNDGKADTNAPDSAGNPVAAAATGAAVAAAMPSTVAQGATVPVGTAPGVPGATAPVGPSPAALTALGQTSGQPIRPVDFGMGESGSGAPWLQALKRQPSYYFRGAPVAATTALSLLFLLWAHNWAVSQDAGTRNVTVEQASTTQIQNGDGLDSGQMGAPGVGGTAPNVAGSNAPVNGAGGTTAATGTTTNNGNNNPSFVANSNGPEGLNVPAGQPGANTGAPQPGAPNGANTDSDGADTGRTGGASNSGRTANTPRFPSVAPRPNDVQNAQELMGSLPPARPQTGARTRPNDAVSVIPSTVPDTPAPNASENTNSRVVSSGGALVNPSGTGRGYVRVSPLRVSPSGAPTRSNTRADEAARAAAVQGRAGNPGRGVELMSPSMDAGDRAWNYQQRALLLLERGDYGRAREDFSTAIAHYREQISRGENVAAAQKAIRACEEGRQEALARAGR